MPYSIQHLLEKQAEVLVVLKDSPLSAALDLMSAHAYSQLPVVDAGQRLLGLLTHESILRAVRSFNARPDELLVRDAMLPAPRHTRDDDLFDLLDELKENNAVVIVAADGCVTGIVTGYDATQFLRQRTEDLMHVEDIEFIIKELLRKARAGGKLRGLRGQQPRAFDELNLADYINLLTARTSWGFFAPILAVPREALCELLEKVRQTRNDLAHFRGEIAPHSRDELRYCANWLRSRYRDYEKEEQRGLLESLPTRPAPDESPRALREAVETYPQGGRETSSLAGWLARHSAQPVRLSFEQIEALMGQPLPPSALALRAWWARPAQPWLDAGWEVRYVDLDEQQAVFARIAASQPT